MKTLEAQVSSLQNSLSGKGGELVDGNITGTYLGIVQPDPDGAQYKFPPARCPESSVAVGVKVYALNRDKGDAAHALAGLQLICKKTMSR